MTDLVEPGVTGPDGADPGREERGRRVELASAGCFVVATLAALALAVVYWQGGQPQAEGILLALTLGGIGTGIVLWAKHFMPSDEVAEDRHPLESSEE
jgi:ubiquinol-cytochrome c reductase iron-sulfur subunit